MALTSLGEQLYVVDPNGDLILILRDGFKMRVSSKTLSLASPRLRDLFEGEPEKILQDEAERPEAVRLLVEIYHFKQPTIKDLTVPLLANIASVCELWGCVGTIGPYKDLWIISTWKPSHPDNERQWREWIQIGRVFGRHDIIQEVMKNKLDGGWREWTDEELTLYSYLAGWGDDVVDAIQQKRTVLINSVFGARNEFLKDMRASRSLCSEKNARCDALILGSLHRKFAVKHDEYMVAVTKLADVDVEGICVEQGHNACTGSVIGLVAHLKSDIKAAMADVDDTSSQPEVVTKKEPAAKASQSSPTIVKTEPTGGKVQHKTTNGEQNRSKPLPPTKTPESESSPGWSGLETSKSAVNKPATPEKPTVLVQEMNRRQNLISEMFPGIDAESRRAMINKWEDSVNSASPNTGFGHNMTAANELRLALEDPNKKAMLKQLKSMFHKLTMNEMVDTLRRSGWDMSRVVPLLKKDGLIPDQ